MFCGIETRHVDSLLVELEDFAQTGHTLEVGTCNLVDLSTVELEEINLVSADGGPEN